jgi:RNA polymerase sigma-70 factor (ECF subfamily)
MLRFFKNKPKDLTDAELVQRFQKGGDMAYLGQLYERYTELVYGVCLKYLKSETEAEDAYMNIFEKLATRMQRYEIQQFKPWLHTLVRNHCIEILRKRNKNLTVSYDSDLMHSEPFIHPLIEEAENGKMKALDACLEQLVGAQKSCVQLFYFQGKTYKEIADLKNLALGKIRSYIQNGRRNLKICIEKTEIKSLGK